MRTNKTCTSETPNGALDNFTMKDHEKVGANWEKSNTLAYHIACHNNIITTDRRKRTLE